ncbi:hypothetical protein JCM19237_5649 [Photobacterium aphoticum]|uniref:Uncharacterized protein n=1 Tax=Photobacterium aphoticum TaxID=754436 RepID=A0A090QIJ1_9GAMM|nr:hypothetical protein JCM19237_5649 [Photobacterium aphoticum]
MKQMVKIKKHTASIPTGNDEVACEKSSFIALNKKFNSMENKNEQREIWYQPTNLD